MKIGGLKYRVRILGPAEKLTEKCFWALRESLPLDISKVQSWVSTSVPGDLVSDHPERLYVEVLSKHFKLFSFPTVV